MACRGFLLYSRLDSSDREHWNVSVPPSCRGKSVKDDWRAWLPEEKAQVFHKQVHELESSYAMLSVSLMSYRTAAAGRTRQISAAVGITSGLAAADPDALGLLRALSEHAKHYGTIPTCASDPANFQDNEPAIARMNSLLNHVLLSHRLHFFKSSTLEEMSNLGKDFRRGGDSRRGP